MDRSEDQKQNSVNRSERDQIELITLNSKQYNDLQIYQLICSLNKSTIVAYDNQCIASDLLDEITRLARSNSTEFQLSSDLSRQQLTWYSGFTFEEETVTSRDLEPFVICSDKIQFIDPLWILCQ
jgi:hypothetical protein